MNIEPLLQIMVEMNASDLFFSVGAPVNAKVEGTLHAITESRLEPGSVKLLGYSLINDEQQAEFEAEMELNFAVSVEKIGRFRVNLYRQRGEVSMVVRHIKTDIPSIEELSLPAVLHDLVMAPRGLILVVGATGSGKSTTLATMIDHRNQTQSGHILTIEDPIEFIHNHGKSIVDQREVGSDTLSYGHALKNAMREAPDLIMMGEIRDKDTMQHAISYAETGHLCMATLHANNSYQTLERVINFFPEQMGAQLLDDLSLNLRAVVCMRLLKGVDGKRIPAVEVLLNTPHVSKIIQDGEIDKLKGVLDESKDKGMSSFDNAVYKLYTEGRVSLEEALHNANSQSNLKMRIRLGGEGMGKRLDDVTF